MSMKELDINLEISYDQEEDSGRKYFGRRFFPHIFVFPLLRFEIKN